MWKLNVPFLDIPFLLESNCHKPCLVIQQNVHFSYSHSSVRLRLISTCKLFHCCCFLDTSLFGRSVWLERREGGSACYILFCMAHYRTGLE